MPVKILIPYGLFYNLHICDMLQDKVVKVRDNSISTLF